MAARKSLIQQPTVVTGVQNVRLPDIERRCLAMRLNGTAGLIVHRFEEKSITEMLAKQRGMPHERGKKNPHRDFEAAKYKNIKEQDCIPVMTVKKAMVEASTFSDDLTKKGSRGAFYIIGEYTPLKFGQCIMRTDIVRTGGIGRAPDIRFRPEYFDWSVDLAFDFNPRLITIEQLCYVAREAGTSIGLCEWRPQKDGNKGTFDIELLPETEIPRIMAECKVPPKPLILPEWVMRIADENENAISEAKRGKGRRKKPADGDDAESVNGKASADDVDEDGAIELS